MLTMVTQSPERAAFVLAPFRGLRFDAERVGDLGTVISPPYDVLDAETVRELEAANRRNIVRLILARHFERPYEAVRQRLERWRADGYLHPDPEPALYLYEYTADHVTVRGLVGLVGLHDPSEHVVLPHEDVMPEPVADRAALMRATETNLEPILLVHEGTPQLRELLDTAAQRPPLVRFTALDGSRHTVWSVVDPAALDAIAAQLAGTEALIADGHHRYAAYRRLQAELRGTAAPGTSPWDHGLALLVDQHDYPLTVGPIHRSVAALTLADVQELAAEADAELLPCSDREAGFALAAETGPGRAAFVLGDGRSWAVLTVKRTHPVDAAVLHEQVLPSWGVAEEQLGYHHHLDQALQTTARQPAVVVAVEPPTLRQVMESAAHGVRMPRKSTSFGPKPRMGVVMRDLRDS